MQSDTRLCRVFSNTTGRAFIVRRNDFKIDHLEQLPSVATLLDGISGRYEQLLLPEAGNSIENSLKQTYASELVITAFAVTALSEGPSFLQSFNEVLKEETGGRRSIANTRPFSHEVLGPTSDGIRTSIFFLTHGRSD